MTTVNGAIKDVGSAGFTGYTRLVIECPMDGTATGATFTIPKTFIFRGFIPTTVGESTGTPYTVTLSVSTGTYTATIGGSAPTADKYQIILIGELGRRDSASRSYPEGGSYTPGENPNYAGNP